MIPSPEQASHLPPFTLKLKRPLEYPLVFASTVDAKRSLIKSNAPVYVAGLDLGVFPIGDWSISITLSSFSIPKISSWAPGIMVRALFKSLASLLYNISVISELFPDPETPVMHVNTPRGIFTSMFFRLFSRAPFTVRYPLGFLLLSGTGIFNFPLRYAPVMDFLFFYISSAVPIATTSPPLLPAPGPISMIQSAALIVSSSCSTTIRELPRSFRSFNAFMSLPLSL